MKIRSLCLIKSINGFILALAMLAGIRQAAAQGTAFTFQGQFSDGANLATGLYDVTFSLYDAATGGNLSGTITNSATGVTNGLFTVLLDFGASPFDGTPRWVEVSARTNGSATFYLLGPRQPVSPVPYAIYAENAAAAAQAGSLVSGGQNGMQLQFVSRHSSFPVSQSSGIDVVGGFWGNTISSGVLGGTIAGGGYDITLQEGVHFVSTSIPNIVVGDFGAIGGGYGNIAGADSVIAGGYDNAATNSASVGGGYGNVATLGSAIAGGSGNKADDYSAVTGGQGNIAYNWGWVGGGIGNVAVDFSTVAGGTSNDANAYNAFIGGGGSYVGAPSALVTPLGSTTLEGNANFATCGAIGGGTANSIPEGADAAVIAGGAANAIIGDSAGASIAGGYSNYVSDQFGAIGGGAQNSVEGFYAVVPGGYANSANGEGSFAAGENAQANDDHAFVWNDGSFPAIGNGDGGPNSVTFWASGGFDMITGISPDGTKLYGASMGPGDSAWSSVCDRNAKKNFRPVDTAAILDKLVRIPIEQWNYTSQGDSDTPNIGPMAQDFKGAFYPGRDDTHISTLEFDGVELAAIQGLNQKVEESGASLESRMEEKEKEIQDLKRQNDSLAERLKQLERKVNQTAGQK